jgi:hypothetical protein
MSSRSLLSSLADPVQRAVVTAAGLVLDINYDLDPRQMRRQLSAVAAALAAPRRTAIRCGSILLRFAGRFDLLDLFQTQQHCSSGSVSALRPKRCRCNSLMI